MAVSEGKCASQFFFTLADGLNEHVVFGRLVEGFETLEQINNPLVDEQGRPLRDIRLRHVIVLDDPFDDPPGILIPPQSPAEPSSHQGKVLRVGDDEELDQELHPVVVEERRREREARAQALTLEMVGDLPFAEVAPPENILFVCKLNSITRSEDLESIFSRFGTLLSCEVIKDAKTGDSLQYAFIEFDQREDAERAYFKMDGVLIDDRRIHVDFSQSVSKLHSDWIFKRTGKRVKPNQTNEQRPKKRQPSERSPPRARRDSKNEMSFDDADLIEHTMIDAHIPAGTIDPIIAKIPEPIMTPDTIVADVDLEAPPAYTGSNTHLPSPSLVRYLQAIPQDSYHRLYSVLSETVLTCHKPSKTHPDFLNVDDVSHTSIKKKNVFSARNTILRSRA
ncbi:peptidylprolyl isomerase [Puccinia graminis f. sp. tritici CRL 75-36-700-3]|uniref:Peptidyl-prolyl cis-trans isomerase n=1 Tax=Puccinia graminis f. sp. tritici (strain CRL 75-36-700-3 / race SCCL) TaxID=418459 RepID=E3KWP7_PUCGT|nr:peptidylprolyl isomerase [Puccinia graminis f. sp. tritici CRL 75-36-700-3]EFP88714.1 peptidylprolyl isomerase [Puccinia graminis f. sp. tritici CRL 75-36-700-3]